VRIDGCPVLKPLSLWWPASAVAVLEAVIAAASAAQARIRPLILPPRVVVSEV
jgi:hypothetical protein